jgi:hypothetical protein
MKDDEKLLKEAGIDPKHIDELGGQTIVDATGMLVLAMTKGPKAPAFREDAA